MGKTAQTTPSASRWSHFWRLLRDLEEAMDTSAVDMLHRRISMIEREVAEIKANQPRGPRSLFGDPGNSVFRSSLTGDRTRTDIVR